MREGVLLQGRTERLDRAAKFAGEVFGLTEEDEIRPAPRTGFGHGRLLVTALALIACGYVFLI
jgi:hypothetical protein